MQSSFSQFGTQLSSQPLLWKLYFPEGEDWTPSSPLALKLERWKRKLSHLLPTIESFTMDGPQNDRSIELTYSSLSDCLGEEFIRDFSATPECTLALLSVASRSLAGQESCIGRITVRIVDFPDTFEFADLRSCMLGRFVQVKGTVVRVNPVQTPPSVLTFRCLRCSQILVLSQPNSIYTPPRKCATPNCNSKQFTPDRTSPETQLRNRQLIRIQEVSTDSCSTIPRSLDCELLDDLVDEVRPGEVAIFCGVLEVSDSEEVRAKVDKNSSQVLKVNSLSVLNRLQEDPFMDAALVEKAPIVAIARRKNCFRFLCDSLCPGIYGHDRVKAGILLTLLRGNEQPRKHHTRAHSHMLIVGDPGLGKSQMLDAAVTAAPRSVFVGAGTSTTAGLTATLHQDGNGEYGLEAGALVLADRGLCAIDEFDKLAADHRSLLEVMEQSTVNVAKAGIVCSLPARTSVIAAANPIGGHYNHSKSLTQNIKLDPAVLSRFDLVFILLDRPGAELDFHLSKKILSRNSTNQPSRIKSIKELQTEAQESSKFPQNQAAAEPTELLPISALRQYLAYAQQAIHPRLSPAAKSILKAFYLESRRTSPHADSLPITTRQLESAIRLAEARAKAELRHTVLDTDAEEVVDMMRYCLYDWLNEGVPTSNPTKGKKPKSKPALIKEFAAELNRIALNTSQSTFTQAQLAQVFTAKFGEEAALSGSLNEILEAMNHHGHLLKKPGNLYKLMST